MSTADAPLSMDDVRQLIGPKVRDAIAAMDDADRLLPENAHFSGIGGAARVRLSRARKALAPFALLLVLLCGCGGLVTVPASTQPAIPTVVDDEQTAVVVSITDGDTFRAHLPTDDAGKSTPIRLIGVDTPETRKPNTPVQCYGPEASAELARLIPVGTTVGLVYDKERTDRYDRTLAYVYTTDTDGARVDVGGRMVAKGAAVAKRYPPNTAMADVYERAQAIAKADGLGLWGACAA